ncbi:MAG TPA: hypothetical protein PLD25_01645 [Chloroflexota bacterium]|nr:hypothetical protein [Chloroflexota bacterium]HUM68417.1 hypothetical protein [Chloroflexota bacterium]
MKGKLRQLLIILGLSIIVPGWFILSGLTLYCSLSFSCDADASGWWSLFLAAIALPIVVFQLYTLRAAIEENVWKPKVDIGIFLFSPERFLAPKTTLGMTNQVE